MQSKSDLDTLRSNREVNVEQAILRTRLESAFGQTAAKCSEQISVRNSVRQLPPEGLDEDGDPIVLDAVGRWRDRSLESVSSAFGHILDAARKLVPDPEVSTDSARELTLEVVYAVFRWTEQDTTNVSKFKEWQSRATGTDLVYNYGVMPASPDCDYLLRGKEANLAELVHCDFRTRIELLLTELQLKAFRAFSSSTTQEKEPEVVARAPRDGEPEPYVEDPDLKLKNNPLKVAEARVRLLDRVIAELVYLRPFLERGDDPEEIAKDYDRRLVIFQVRLKEKLLLDRRTWNNTAFKRLACQIAAAKAGGLSASYMGKARERLKDLTSRVGK